MAGRVCLSPVRRALRLDDEAKSAGVRLLRPPGLADGGDNLSGHPETADAVVPGDVVDDDSKERGPRPELAADLGVGQLRDRLDVKQVAVWAGSRCFRL